MRSYLLRFASSVVFVSAVAGLGGCGSDDNGTPSPTDTGTKDTGGLDTGSPDTGSPDTGMVDTGNPETPGDSGDGGGGDSGGLSCETYCDKATTSCTAALALYADKATCLKVCAKFDVGTVDDKSGDTLGCRTYHVGAASAGGAAATTHCPHSGGLGGDVCGTSRCDNFCKLALAQCPKSAGGLHTDVAACKTACAAAAYDATKADIDATAKGKLNCLNYHLQAAFGDPATHCGHLAVTAGLPCAP